LVTTATRRASAVRRAACENGSAGGGAHEASPGSGPASRSSSSAVSPTVRVSTPSTARKLSPASGAIEMRPRWGLRPTSPQQAAGIRVDPPPSLAWATGTMPAATAVAEPPDEPPLVRCGSHGLRVGPKRFVLIHGRIAHSGVVVVPTTTKPASLIRRTTLESWSGAQSPASCAPHVRRWPASARLFLMATGTPAKGRSSPLAIPSAVASASSPMTSTNALRLGLSSSMRSSDACTSSRADSSPERTRLASSVAGRRRRSDMAGEPIRGRSCRTVTR
jgi:hypothetical protein